MAGLMTELRNVAQEKYRGRRVSSRGFVPTSGSFVFFFFFLSAMQHRCVQFSFLTSLLFACVGASGATAAAVQQQSLCVCVAYVPEDTHQCSSHSHSPRAPPYLTALTLLDLHPSPQHY